jgi:DNA-directed RNA polymerase subunit RPC12/RpoP
MAAATKDAGVPVTCPGCGETVLQKAMIPILGDGGTGIRYVCVACARKLVDPDLNDAAQTEASA